MTTDTIGEVWTYSLELSRALSRRGGEVILATMGAPLTLEQRRAVQAIPRLEVLESTYKLEWMPDPWLDVYRAGDWLLSLEEELQPDVIHLVSYSHGNVPFRTPTLVVGHSCVLSRWQAIRGEPLPPEWDRYRYEVTLGLRGADLVLAPTRAMLDTLRDLYGPLPQSRIVPNGRSPQLFYPAEKEPLVLTAGHLWDEARNIAALEAVAPSLEWPVYVADEERDPNGSGRRPEHIRRLGHLSQIDLASWLGRATIYALPTRYEPLGLSILEAGLAGCALVVGDVPSLREVWGDAALFVPPHDTDALRRALQELIDDPVRCASMAGRARLRALEYSPDRMAEGYLASYEEMLTIGQRLAA